MPLLGQREDPSGALAGPVPGRDHDRAEKVVGIDGRAGEHERDGRIGLHLRFEMLGEVAVIDDRRPLLVHLVVRQVELRIEDDAEQTVAPDDEAEQLGILVPARLDDLPVRGEHAQAPDRLDNTRLVEIAPVSVRREGAADREDIRRLHHLDREAVRSDRPLHVVPGRSGLDPENLPLPVERQHLVEIAHVDGQGVVVEDMASLAVAAPRDRDLQALLARLLHQRDELLDLARPIDPVDDRGFDATDVGEPARIRWMEEPVIRDDERAGINREGDEDEGGGEKRPAQHRWAAS